MGNIQGIFADQNDLVLTGQIQTANNNQSTLNAVMAETDQVRGTSVVLQPTGVLGSPGAPNADVAAAAQGTVGAALAGIGQTGTPSEEPGGGGLPCFIGATKIDTPTGDVHIRQIQLGDTVWAFDSITGVRIPKRVVGKYEHLVDEYTLVEFSDGHTTGVVDIHRYWQKNGQYREIKDIDTVWHWDGEWKEVRVVQRTVVKGEVVVYNMTVKDEHNYIANGDATSNLKPLGGPEV
jgi:hypothetical protein